MRTIRAGVRWDMRRLRERPRALRDRLLPTYTQGALAGGLQRRLGPLVPAALMPASVREVCDLYLRHYFNVLGSGWVQVRYGMTCRGLEGYRHPPASPIRADPAGGWLLGRINKANLSEARRIWTLVTPGYVPIDWHLDFKSGYRWWEQEWYLDIRLGHLPGVDIKVPWELTRMQHLPQLALVYGHEARGGNGELASRCAAEFRNQVLDFVATNPPRFGVNWRSTMDVAIRVVNWLVAYDLLRAHTATFDQAFEDVFARSVYEHGRHIVGNLQSDREFRTNHYLADVTGLLFVAAYLPRTGETDWWTAFATGEFIHELQTQFHPDGTNFEASTCYHRLSTEMALYGFALLLRLREEGRVKQKLPIWLREHLGKMVDFTRIITKPSGLVPQIGDNDNGRFLKLQPALQRLTVREAKVRHPNLADYGDLAEDSPYWDEVVLDHRHLFAAAEGLVPSDGVEGDRGGVEEHVISMPARTSPAGSPPGPVIVSGSSKVRVGDDADWRRSQEELAAAGPDRVDSLELSPSGGNLLDALGMHGYPFFGVYLFRSRRLYLAIRCGPIGQRGIGGHAHNDQLSLELAVDGQDWIVDPGTYLYTPLPARRQEYRSVKAHFTPRVKDRGEPGRLDLGLFRLGNEADARCLYFGPRGFVGMHRGFGPPVYRIVELCPDVLRVRDYCPQSPLQRLGIHRTARAIWPDGGVTVSPGYGVRYAGS